MNRWLACSLAGTISAFALVSLTNAGCGGSAINEQEGGHPEAATHDHFMPPVDGGKDQHVGKDSGKDVISPFGDSGPDTGDGGGIPTEGGPTIPPGATQLVNTVDAGLQGLALLQFIGITDDDYVIYVGTQTTALPVYAVSVAGGAPIEITKDIGTTGGYGPSISHKTVLFWSGGTTTSPGNVVGAFHYWTKANGLQSPTGNSTVGLAAASPDGAKVVYSTNVSTDGSSGDMVASNSDGTGKTTLLSGVVTNSTATTTFFSPEFGFSNDSYLVGIHESPADAGGFTPAVVSCWDTTAWTKTDLITGAATSTGFGTPVLTGNPSPGSWSTSTTGAGFGGTIVAATSAGALQAFTLPSPTVIAIDTGVDTFTVKPDGTGVLYGTKAGAYKLAPLPAGTPAATILATGYGGFITGFSTIPAFSTNGNYALFYKLAGGQIGEYDLNLIMNSAAATSTSLLSAPTGAVFNDAFTLDNGYALYYTSFKLIGTSAAVGALYAYPVAGSKAIPVSTNNVWNSYSVSGSKISYNDNYVPGTTANTGFADIYTVDVAATTLAPVSIVKSADENYYLNAARTKLVFSMSLGNTSTDGIWVVTP